jgi:hypothetical protein
MSRVKDNAFLDAVKEGGRFARGGGISGDLVVVALQPAK